MAGTAVEMPPEIRRALRVAEQYGYPFVDLSTYREDVGLWQRVPMELVVRYRFVPLREEGAILVIAVSNPGRYQELDDLELAIRRPLGIEVAPDSQIELIVQRNASSSFLLEEASEQLRLEVRGDQDAAVEELSGESGKSTSPVIKLVDSLILSAVERRASDIHIESKDREVVMKYRIDGVLSLEKALSGVTTLQEINKVTFVE